MAFKRKPAIKKRKPDTILVGGGLTSLISGAFLACRGFKVIIFEKNSSVGGMLASRNKVINQKKYSIPGVIPLLPALEHPTMKSIWEFTKIGSVVKFQKAKQITVLKNNTSEKLIPNDWVMLQKRLKQKFPKSSDLIGKFFNSLKKVYADLSRSFYFHEDEKYINGFEFLKNFFKNESLANEIILISNAFDFESEKCNSRELMYNLALYLIGGVYEILGSPHQIVEKLSGIIEAYEGDIYTKTPVEKIMWKNNLVTGVVANNKVWRAKKYLINAPLPYVVKKLVQVKSVKLSNYEKLLEENDGTLFTLTMNFYTSQNWRKFGFYKPNFVVNPSENFIKQHSCLQAISGKTKTIKITNNELIYDSGDRTRKPLSVHIQTTEKQLADLKIKKMDSFADQIFDYLKTIWPMLKTIQYQTIVEGLQYQKKTLNSLSGSDYGFANDSKVFWGNYTSQTPLLNLYVGSRYGYPGPGIASAFFGGVFVSNLMLIKINKSSQKLYKPDYLDGENYLNYMINVHRTIPKKLHGKKLGITFDKENSFIISFNKDNTCVLKKSEFDGALNEEFFCYATLANFKSLYTHRLSMFLATFQNKIRLKGKLKTFKIALRTLGWNRTRKEYY